MASIFTTFSDETPYEVDGVFYSKDSIVDMHRKIQSVHDKDKSLEFSETELAVKKNYKDIQSKRDSERIKALRQRAENVEVGSAHIESLQDLTPYQLGTNCYSKMAIVQMYKEIQSAHDKVKGVEFTPVELQIKQWYREIQSERDSERIRGLKNPPTADDSVSGTTFYQLGGEEFSEDEIVAKYYAIQSVHAKDKSLEFTDYELQIKEWRREIQSKRDSMRLKMRRATPIDSVLATTPLAERLEQVEQKLFQLSNLLTVRVVLH